MVNLKSWEVDLSVSGPISIAHQISMDVEKGYQNPFTTNVKLRRTTFGVNISLIARASNLDQANSAGVFFVGQMLDLLGLMINLPLYLGITGTETRIPTSNVRRILDQDEITAAFNQSRYYGQHYPAYTRSLSWYRKSITSEDPIDEFLALWSALESVAAKHARDNERANRGVINKICDCFDQLWGDVESWKVIPNEAEWINQFYETRNGIAHGYIQVEVDTIREIQSKLKKLKLLTYDFLSDWENFLPNLH